MSNNIVIDKQKLIRTLINNTPIAYIIMDDTNRIHYVNESFLKLRGLEWSATLMIMPFLSIVTRELGEPSFWRLW